MSLLASIMVKTIVKYGIEEGEGFAKKIVPTFNAGDELAVTMVKTISGMDRWRRLRVLSFGL